MKSTNELVNGIALTITSSEKFDYADCYETLNPVIDIFYGSVKSSVKSNIYIKPPTDIEVEISLNEKRLVGLSVIAPHKNRDNFHIHFFLYGLHNFNVSINDFSQFIDSKIKKLKNLSSKNRYSVLMKPITDQLDKQIREHNSYQPLLDYIKNPQYDTFTHYLKHKNSNQFIYTYL